MGNVAKGHKDREHISTVEELHDYMHVTNPRLWAFLLVIMTIIVAGIVYASTITLDNTLHATAEVGLSDNKKDNPMVISLTIPEGYEEVIKVGMPVLVGNEPGKISLLGEYAEWIEEQSSWAMVSLDDSSKILPPGDYDATITIESASPLSFLIN